MGRPAAGSVRRRGNSWLASVPKHKGSKSRVEVSFRDKTAADRWVSAQLWRLERGLEAERPAKPPRLTNERPVQHAGTVTRPLNQVVTADVANGMTFERLARLWHAERYEEMEKAGAERSHELLRDIELHLIPTFKDLLTMDLFGGRALVKAWLRSKSGRDPEDFGDVLDADPSPKGKATVRAGYPCARSGEPGHAPTMTSSRSC